MPRIMLVVMAIGMGAVLTACGVEEPVPTGSPLKPQIRCRPCSAFANVR